MTPALPPAIAILLDDLAAGWRDAEPGPVTTTADNALRLARTLYVQLSLGVRAEPGAEVVLPWSGTMPSMPSGTPSPTCIGSTAGRYDRGELTPSARVRLCYAVPHG